MTFTGHVVEGKVVLDAPIPLPDGTPVRVEPVAGWSSAVPVITAGTGDWHVLEETARELRAGGYDFDAWKRQRDHDLAHAGDHLP
jgi:hypothetical protein